MDNLNDLTSKQLLQEWKISDYPGLSVHTQILIAR